MAEILVHFKAEPPAELFARARGGSERLALLQKFYAPLKYKLRQKLRGYRVEVSDLNATGAVLVRGSQGTLANLTTPGGALDSLDISIAENVDFFPTR